MEKQGRKRFASDFKCIRGLGYGAKGFVVLVTKNSECETEAQLNDESRGYALKMVGFKNNRITGKETAESVDDLQEATILAALDHDNIIRYHDSWKEDNVDGDAEFERLKPIRFAQLRKEGGKFDGYLFIQTQLCSSTLQSLLEKPKTANHLPLMRKYLYQICCGMSEAHSKKIVHNDLKAANIFLLENDEPRDEQDNFKAVVGDFGFGLGTNPYFSPEQKEATDRIGGIPSTDKYAKGRIIVRAIPSSSDVYVMGLVYAQMILRLVAKNQLTPVFDQIRADQRPDGIPEAEWKIISLMTAQAPADRITFARLLELDYFEEIN